MAKFIVEYANHKGTAQSHKVTADDEAAALGLVLDLREDVPQKRFAPRFIVQRIG